MAHGDLTTLEIMSSDMVIAHPSSEGGVSTELEVWSVNTNPTWDHKGSQGTFGSTVSIFLADDNLAGLISCLMDRSLARIPPAIPDA